MKLGINDRNGRRNLGENGLRGEGEDDDDVAVGLVSQRVRECGVGSGCHSLCGSIRE